MRCNEKHLLSIIAFLASSIQVGAKQGLRRAQSQNVGRIFCAFAQIEEDEDDITVEKSWRYVPDPDDDDIEGLSYVIELRSSFVSRNKELLYSGEAFVELSRVSFRNDDGIDTVDYGSIVKISDEPPDRIRQLSTSTGSQDVLVVTVSANDAGSTSPTRLRRTVFGSGTSLASQLSDCSDSALDLVPADGSKNIDMSGVLEVSIDFDVEDTHRTVVENAVTEAVHDELSGSGLSLLEFGFVFYCLPSGTLGNWKSEGYLNWHRALFNGDKCNDINYLMHAIGHNFGLYPSLDRSGMMGPSLDTYAPRMCYDAANSWRLDWYDSQKVEVNPFDESWGGRLTGVVDYVNGNTFGRLHEVLVRIVSESDDDDINEDLYLMFNRAKGFNRNTRDFVDEVTVVRRALTGDDDEVVNTIASLTAGERLEVANFGGSGETLFILCCDFVIGSSGNPDYARVVVNLGDETSLYTCRDLEVFSGFSVGFSDSPNTNLPPCEDSETEKATIEGVSRSCEWIKTKSRNNRGMRKEWCTRRNGSNAAKEICMETCEEWARCTNKKSSSVTKTSVTTNISVTTQKSTQTNPVTKCDEDSTDTFTRDNYQWTCEHMSRTFRKKKNLMEDFCKRSEAKNKCKTTCFEWNGCD